MNTSAKVLSDSSGLATPSICALSIDYQNNTVAKLYWYNSDTNAVKFIIYKRLYFEQIFDSIGIVSAQELNEYKDSLWYGDYYKIQAVDDSGRKSMMSAECSNTLIGTELVEDSVILLKWEITGEQGDSLILFRRNDRDYNLVTKMSILDTAYLDTVDFPIYWFEVEYLMEIQKADICYSSIDSTNAIKVYSNHWRFSVGSANSNLRQYLSAYPNPVNENLKFDSKINIGSAQIVIYNNLGQIVIEDFIHDNELNVENLGDGFYHFLVDVNGVNFRGSFIKSH